MAFFIHTGTREYSGVFMVFMALMVLGSSPLDRGDLIIRVVVYIFREVVYKA